MSLLEVRGITMRFGGLTAVDDVSFNVDQGQIFAVIGPNGAGKTTLFNAITGVYEPTEGSVRFRGSPVRLEPDARLGLRAAMVAILAGLSAFLAINIQELWSVGIAANYVLNQPFPWGKAAGDALDAARAVPFAWGVLPAILGAGVGAGTVVALWQRSRRTPDLIARAGLARTFQNIRLFTDLSLVENVLVGMDSRMRSGFWTNLLRANAHGPSVKHWNCWSSSACPSVRTRPRAACPTATVDGWRSREPWRASPRCCCSMSRRRA